LSGKLSSGQTANCFLRQAADLRYFPARTAGLCQENYTLS